MRRLLAAWRVLLGYRPAEVRFNERDKDVAREIASFSARVAVERLTWPYNVGREDRVLPVIQEEIYLALLWYAAFDKDDVEDLLGGEAGRTKDPSEAPF